MNAEQPGTGLIYWEYNMFLGSFVEGRRSLLRTAKEGIEAEAEVTSSSKGHSEDGSHSRILHLTSTEMEQDVREGDAGAR